LTSHESEAFSSQIATLVVLILARGVLAHFERLAIYQRAGYCRDWFPDCKQELSCFGI